MQHSNILKFLVFVHNTKTFHAVKSFGDYTQLHPDTDFTKFDVLFLFGLLDP